MSEQAQGLIILGVTRAQAQRWLAAQRQAAFVAAGPGRGVRVWPRLEGQALEALAAGVTEALERSRVLALSTRGEVAQLAVYAAAQCVASGEVALRLGLAKELAQAHAALQRVTAALESKHRPPPLVRGEASLPAFLGLVGAAEEDMAGLHYAALAEARRRPKDSSARRFQDFSWVSEAGEVESFFPEAQKPAVKKSVPKKAAVKKTTAKSPAAKKAAAKKKR